MVIKGSARGGAVKLAAHLQRTDTNEKMRVVEMRDVAAEDLRGALIEMDALGCALRTQRTLYHASINTRADEAMTPEQWRRAVDRLEQELDLTGQPRVIVEHQKEGREHVHIVWARTDLEHMRAIRCDHNYRKHETVARELEQEFGHERVQGAHAERDGVERPERTPSHAEMQQAERTGLTPREAKEQLTELWNRTDSGQAFAAALDEAGWILARGDKRDFVVLDPAAEVHSLTRRIDGAKAKDVRARMADLDAASLPSVEEARELQHDRAQSVTPARNQIAWQDELAAAIAKAEAEAKPAPDDTKAVLPVSERVVARELTHHEAREQREATAEAHAEHQPEAATRALIREADHIENTAMDAAGQVMDGAQEATAKVAGAVDAIGESFLKVADSVLDFFLGAPPPAPRPAPEVIEERAAASKQKEERAAMEERARRLLEEIARGEEGRERDDYGGGRERR